jgi:FkbH-like protein
MGERKIKCVVWDLDNTLWDGILLEDKNVSLRAEVVELIKTLDCRGILQSIASKNDHATAMEKLKMFHLDEYFIYPQINWNPKSSSIKNIAKSINIGIDTLAFIDDQEFERAEVQFSLPEVLCLDADNLVGSLDRPEFNPRFVTEDSKNRRLMYISDIERNKVEGAYEGNQEEFLASLKMKLSIAPVTKDDLQRAEELTVRTHQLNATGYTYSYEELDQFSTSNQHKLLIAGLEDKFGTYGKIGLALIECDATVWTVKLLLMSCRVMSRGVGTVLLNHIVRMAKQANVRLLAEFVATDRNRVMYVTYKFAGFKEIEERKDITIFENDFSNIQAVPDYLEMQATY